MISISDVKLNEKFRELKNKAFEEYNVREFSNEDIHDFQYFLEELSDHLICYSRTLNLYFDPQAAFYNDWYSNEVKDANNLTELIQSFMFFGDLIPITEEDSKNNKNYKYLIEL
jgi:hypothetical protein